MTEARRERNRIRRQLREEKQLLQQKRKWIRHTATVPKGFIRHQVLIALNEKPLSGSELIENIEKNTGGFWKPSPGSIYPLLAYLQDSGYMRELPTENGMKRYELNEKGKTLLEDQRNIMRKYKETMGFQSPFGDFFRKVPPEKAVIVRGTFMRAGRAMFQLSSALRENFSEEALDEAGKVIDEASEKLEKIAKKIEGEKKIK